MLLTQTTSKKYEAGRPTTVSAERLLLNAPAATGLRKMHIVATPFYVMGILYNKLNVMPLRKPLWADALNSQETYT